MDIKATIKDEGAALENEWKTNPRWKGVRRDYTAAEVIRVRGSFATEHTLAKMGAARLWELLHTEDYVGALGALTGMQAVQMVKGGLKAIYLSGWQVAADNNIAQQTYPDQSLYPSNSVPWLIRRINNALRRQDQIEWVEGKNGRHWMAPIIADAEAGFGGPLNAYELMKDMIEAGASAVHFEDQLASEKKCGHMGGKVLVPTRQHIRALTAARLAADVAGAPTLIVARTDSLGAKLIVSDIDERDKAFLTGERTPEGYYYVKPGMEAAIQRSLAYAPYADLLWFETSRPDLNEAKRFADAIHAKFPGKLLAYNCSPSFHWRKNLDGMTIAEFQRKLGAMGYKFQFVTLAGFHTLTASMFELAKGYAKEGMTAYVRLQDREFEMDSEGYTAAKHQREASAGYFDEVTRVIAGDDASTLALEGSTEEEQFRREEVIADRVETVRKKA